MKALGIAASAGILAVIVGATPVACGSGFTAGASSDAGGDSSTASDGPTPETSGGETGGDTAKPAEGGDATATGSIVYVAPTGNDMASGLDPAQPKRTVTAALVAAKQLTGPKEVHVCKGTYLESGIVVDFDLKLLGAYDCTSWMRTATYGYPHPDGVDPTVLAAPDTVTQEAAVVVTGPVTHAAVIDGFTITGASTTTAHTDGVHITTAAAPTLSNDEVSGGSGVSATAGAAGSVGILVDGEAAPEIEGCFVTGGSGRGPVGSVGVELGSTGGVSLHDSLVSGGTGQTSGMSGTSTIGVDVSASLTTPLTSLIVAGTDAVGTMGESVGVRIAGSAVTATLAVCYIDGGLGLDMSAPSMGVLIDTPGSGVTLTGDRIHGGTRTGGIQQTYGVFVVAAGSLTIEDTLVHAGTVQAVSGAYAVGIDLSAVASPVVAFDTVYIGAAAGTGVAFNTGVSGALLRDDVLLGSDTAGGAIAVASTQCGVVSSLDHTAFGNLTTLYACTGATGSTSASNLAELAVALGAAQSHDVDVASTCISTDTSCAMFAGCPGPPAMCLPGIFGATWSPDDGVSSLFGSTGPDAGAPVQGWTLVPGASCDITSGGTAYGSVTVDAYGVKRNPTTPTMGAVEYPPAQKCTAN